MRMQAVWNAAALAVIFIAVRDSAAGEVKLWGFADGDTTYIEEPSDGFIRVDLYDPPPRQTQQRFHSITNPNNTYGSFTYDGFPNDEHFRMGAVSYDESGLVGGSGLAPITGLSLGIGHNPDDPSYHNYYRWLPTDTVVKTFSGTVTLNGGVVTSINLQSTVHLEAHITPDVFYTVPGWFDITGNRFEGNMTIALGGPTQEAIWDLSGTLFTVGYCAPGDYLCNGTADVEDYDFWHERYDSKDPAPDGNGNGVVDAADYVVWRMHAAGAGSSASVPEPASMILLLSAISASAAGRCAARNLSSSRRAGSRGSGSRETSESI